MEEHPDYKFECLLRISSELQPRNLFDGGHQSMHLLSEDCCLQHHYSHADRSSQHSICVEHHRHLFNDKERRDRYSDNEKQRHLNDKERQPHRNQNEERQSHWNQNEECQSHWNQSEDRQPHGNKNEEERQPHRNQNNQRRQLADQHQNDEQRQPYQHLDNDEERHQAESDQRDATRLLADNFLSYLAALLFTLTIGLSLSPLSTALAATGRSDEPRKALRRYASTARHIIAWHLADPLGDPQASQAADSAVRVRRVHAEAARSISGGSAFPAGDMRTVQTAFVAFALLHRRLFGVRCRSGGEQQLAAYARHWHRIGLALGMAEVDSALAGDLRSCRSACADVQLRLLAALQSPPLQFRPLADALAGGVLLVTRLPIASSPPAMVAIFLDAAGAPDAMRRRALAAVGYRPVRDGGLATLLRCLLCLLGWAPRRLHRLLFARTCARLGLRLPNWWRLEHAGEL